MMRITILGCGASSGVPMIGKKMPENPKNIRLRPSIYVSTGSKDILFDTSPDLRQQALVHELKNVDAVFYTHAHADHLHGIDDIKGFNMLRQGPIDMFADDKTLAEITERFAYCFRPPSPEFGWFRPTLVANKLNILEEMEYGGLKILPFWQEHGRVHSIGYRLNDFIYSTDVKNFPKESEVALYNAKIWVVDAMRKEPSPAHSHLEQTLKWIEKFKPEKAYITHMNGQMDYDELLRELPAGVEPAYDGLILEL